MPLPEDHHRTGCGKPECCGPARATVSGSAIGLTPEELALDRLREKHHLAMHWALVLERRLDAGELLDRATLLTWLATLRRHLEAD